MATIVDIDDTLLRYGTRPIRRVIDYVNALPGSIIIVTGRPNSQRAETVRALRAAGVKYSRLIMMLALGLLIVKKAFLLRIQPVCQI